MPKIHKNPDKKEDNKLTVYKDKIFVSYLAWRAMPAVLIGKSEEMLKEMGIIDEASLELTGIQNQISFAKHFNVDKTTLTVWNRRLQNMNSWICMMLQW